MKKKIIYFLSVILIITFCIALSACDEDDLLNGTADDYFKNVNMPLVYEIYLDYMEEIGEAPLTYEEWFEVVHGDEFQKGILPEIRKNDLTDFWEISYNNGKGWNDLRFKTETEEQKNCKHSFDKWIILCEGNDYCNGIRYRNCKNCNYKDYQFKLNDNICLHLELETIAGTPATCASEGLTDGQKCAKCGEIVVAQETLSKLNHIYNDEYDAVCNVCGYEREAECPHSELEIIPGNTATCSKTGLTEGKKCVKCGEMVVEQEMIGKLDHTIVIDSAVESTCTSTGLTEGRHCSVCEEIIVPQQEIPLKDHNFENRICAKCGTVEYSKGLEYTLSNNGTSYSVTSIGTCTELNIIIPNMYNGLPVTSIGNNAFEGCNNFTSVVIPNTVASIGNSAFYGCSNLTSIVIPDTVTSIGGYTFACCDSLTNIVIPSHISKIGSHTFYRCSSLNNLMIPSNVTSIDSYAFARSGLDDIVIPNSVTSMGWGVFAYCSGITSIVIPNSVTSMGNGIFEGCTNLTSVTISNSITSIGGATFAECSSLMSVVIPKNVTNIGEGAFRDCVNLTSIEIPNSVISIERSVFDGCSSLTYNEYDNAYYLANNTNPYLILIRSKDTSITSCQINPNTKFINSYAFAGCSDLVSIVVPDSVISISECTFGGCSSLATIVISNSLTRIDDMIFRDCISLTKVVIPNSVSSIGWGAFEGCSNLISIVIPNSVGNIDDYAFAYCGELTSINFEGTITQWNDIAKASYWDEYIDSYTVYCTDGILTK